MIYAGVRYTYAAGLGNRLWPWARCAIYSHLHQVPMLKPIWIWPMRLGPLVNQKMPLTTWPGHLYLNLFRTAPGQVSGLRRMAVLARADRVPEPADLRDRVEGAGRLSLVTFEGEGGQFTELAGYEGFLAQAIRAMTRASWLGVVDAAPMVPIGVHVRRSDFRRAAAAADYQSKGALQTPMSWFVDALRLIRKLRGRDEKAYLVSDGQPDELRELLAEPHVELVRPASPISDMLLLSRAEVLIGSGGSSFSAWASFLGGMPTVSHPGQSLRWFLKALHSSQYIGELDPSAPSAEFLASVAR
jgi:hypothetical protein